jgi:hypothetical protein
VLLFVAVDESAVCFSGKEQLLPTKLRFRPYYVSVVELHFTFTSFFLDVRCVSGTEYATVKDIARKLSGVCAVILGQDGAVRCSIQIPVYDNVACFLTSLVGSSWAVMLVVSSSAPNE